MVVTHIQIILVSSPLVTRKMQWQWMCFQVILFDIEAIRVNRAIVSWITYPCRNGHKQL